MLEKIEQKVLEFILAYYMVKDLKYLQKLFW